MKKGRPCLSNDVVERVKLLSSLNYSVRKIQSSVSYVCPDGKTKQISLGSIVNILKEKEKKD